VQSPCFYLGGTSYTQVTSPTNNANFFPQFVGYNGFGFFAKPLEIRNDFNRPITLHTNSEQRMHISENVGVNQGFVGIGNSFSAPQSRLHINELLPVPPVNGGTECYAQWTNSSTGNGSANEGLRVGINGAGVSEIRQQENLPLVYFTNNVETARMEPFTATTLAGNPGMMGIGNFSSQTMDAKLDIDGDLRIRQVTQDDTLDMVLVIDPNDLNRVHWRDATTIGGGGTGGVTADNGLTIGPNINNVQLGQIFGGSNGELLHHTEVPFNDFNLHFTGDDIANTNSITIGNMPGTQVLIPNGAGAKLTVYSGLNGATNLIPTNDNSYGIYARNSSIPDGGIGKMVGVYGSAIGTDQVPNKGGHIGGDFVAENSGSENIGVRGRTSAGVGVWGEVPVGNGYAGWFEGDVWINGNGFVNNGTPIMSDQQFKTNITVISDANSIIKQLLPKTFFMDTTNAYGLNFSSQKQYGFIAQDIELVLPELVSEFTKPAVYDSTGNLITPSSTFKNLNYNAFIALLMKGMQEQQLAMDSLSSVINEQDSINADLEDRLTEIENCLGNTGICNNPNGGGNGNRTSNTEVVLENLNAIILDQNLPNPFAEKTTINYTIPKEVSEATLLFYDMNGRIIKQVEITERGEGKITVYGENLKNGIYTYSLIADGELIATKKMLKQ